ncbi:MAG: hypothetical protein ACTSU3_00665 [Candidatus Thorarchaeota archaeon]
MVTSLFSIAFVNDVAADGINIIDYDYEGIDPDTTQFFVIWNHGSNPHDIQVNISALEFVGATGWPNFEVSLYDFNDYGYDDNPLATCNTDDNYTCQLVYAMENQTRYVVAVRNLDPVDDAIYNITIRSDEDLDFQYTGNLDMDLYEGGNDETIAITYFESANPYLYRLESYSDTRIVLEWINRGSDEYYIFIYNKGPTCEMFVGLIGYAYFYDYPSVTGIISDFEDLDAGIIGTNELELFTIFNSSAGGTFTCEKDHRYRFWIDVGTDEPAANFIFDTLGSTPLDFDVDVLAENPDDMIALRGSNIDPWLEYRELNRDAFYWFLGVGGATTTGIVFTLWYLRRKYY